MYSAEENKKPKTEWTCCILAPVLTVAGTPSSCRAPWFDTRIPFTPSFTAFLASSAEKNKKIGSATSWGKLWHQFKKINKLQDTGKPLRASSFQMLISTQNNSFVFKQKKIEMSLEILEQNILSFWLNSHFDGQSFYSLFSVLEHSLKFFR